MPHFFINSSDVINNNVCICDKENYNHIARSLRIRISEKLLLIDENQIQYETTVKEISSKCVEVVVDKSYKSERNLKFQLFLGQSPLRSDAQNIVVEKATELGAAGIYPVVTDNCALNKSVIEKKIPKWQRIMYEASKQCERAVVPTCYDAIGLSSLIEKNEFDKVIAFCERRTNLSLKDYFCDTPIKNDDKVLIIIGPEGGFSEKEFEYFEENKIPMLTLGDLILKAETAVIVGLGNVIYEFENNK